MQGFLRSYAETGLQTPFDLAVVIPSLLRPTLGQALASVFAQDFNGRIQVLVGIDLPQGELGAVEAACAARPPHVAVQLFWPGYSTSTRHGGLMAPADGGALRALLTLLANARYVAYLDDDNWWAPAHLSRLRAAVAQADWGFALRWFMHPQTRLPVCVDTWESVGPAKGMFARSFGGFVDPSCLMIDKLACPEAALHWNHPLRGDAGSADRRVFAYLARRRAAGSGAATVFYQMNARDPIHGLRVKFMGSAYDAAGVRQSA